MVGADSVDGGASTVFPSAVDYLWLTDGVYVSSDLANVTGIESIALYGTGQLIVGTDLLDQASSGALLFVTAAIGTQTIDASQSGTPADGFASKLVFDIFYGNDHLSPPSVATSSRPAMAESDPRPAGR